MARKNKPVLVGRRRLELSNLDKVLWPGDGIIKAELIDYYHRFAPTILKHIKGRPLSLVRYPDGIEGEAFFQKSRPDWAPVWMEGFRHDTLEYMLATEEASLIFLANLACIEIHPFQSRLPHIEKPDYMIFDLDPPEESAGVKEKFKELCQVALELRDFLEKRNYHTFIKTTGGKGLHILAPLLPRADYRLVFDAARDLAEIYCKRDARTTLNIKKERRQGRILIDVYRNRLGQTIIGPYSVRGRPEAPVSAPLLWSEVPNLESPLDFHLRNMADRLEKSGDPWEGFASYAVELPLALQAESGKTRADAKRKKEAVKKLTPYLKKRDLNKTPEPGAQSDILMHGRTAISSGYEFVVHRHHAARLHYDLRLEINGTLRCWALPRGFPPRPGVKRLAVQTEDHPLKYLDFSGTIPQGQYGAGQMWVFARGKHEIFKEKKSGFYVRLSSPQLSADYRLIEMQNKEWLMERLDRPESDFLKNLPAPMMAENRAQIPEKDRYRYELKWDGIRAIIALEEGQIKINSRNGHDITAQFPELLRPDDFGATTAVFDGEIVVLDEEGRPVFESVIRRLRTKSSGSIERLRKKNNAVCYLFDALYLDGRSLLNDPLYLRQEWLADALKEKGVFRISESLEDGQALWAAVQEAGLEGIVAKDRTSRYLPGQRSSAWQKIKTRNAASFIIAGWTRGRGGRMDLPGSLVLGRFAEKTGQLEYAGRVGSGFSNAFLNELKNILSEQATGQAIFSHPDLKDTIWIRPELVADVSYSNLTGDGLLRAPVFLRLRPDLAPADC